MKQVNLLFWKLLIFYCMVAWLCACLLACIVLLCLWMVLLPLMVLGIVLSEPLKKHSSLMLKLNNLSRQGLNQLILK